MNCFSVDLNLSILTYMLHFLSEEVLLEADEPSPVAFGGILNTVTQHISQNDSGVQKAAKVDIILVVLSETIDLIAIP